MARFTVVWQPDVLSDYTTYWVAAESPLRQVLTEIANAIDRELTVDPHKRGSAVPNESGVRILKLTEFEANVSVVFECIPDDRIARVMRVQFRAD